MCFSRDAMLWLVAFVGLVPAASSSSIGEERLGKKNWYDGIPNVIVLSPDDSLASSQQLVNQIYDRQKDAHFEEGRYAILLKPGKYAAPFHVPVGYYTSVIGVGRNANEVELGKVGSYNGLNGHATNNFWRSFEGLTLWDADVTWAVSQASPMRRSIIKGNLHLSQDEKYSSGGFMSDVEVHGKLFMGTQQQWFFRNVDLSTEIDCPAGWNYVFVGGRGLGKAAENWCDSKTVGKTLWIPETPRVAEKPYLVHEPGGEWRVYVPGMKTDSSGVTTSISSEIELKEDGIIESSLSLEDEMFIAQPNHSLEEIQRGIDGKRGLLITPGIYEFISPLFIETSDFVVLGIGFPTLVSAAGQPALLVGDGLHGVRIAGLLLEAGMLVDSGPSLPLLQWGASVSSAYTAPDYKPGVLSDIFVRVGAFAYRGCQAVRADTMMEINSDDVVLDHIWLWHADHDDCGTNITHPGISDECSTTNALVVNGRRVISYGLAAEHTVHGSIVLWNGEEGQTYFYQSELPYHGAQFGDHGHVGYKVSPAVQQHFARGIGVYIIGEEPHNVKGGFLLPSFADVDHVFTVVIAGKYKQFRHVACDSMGEVCYDADFCKWMRCWLGAFPRKALPKAIAEQRKQAVRTALAARVLEEKDRRQKKALEAEQRRQTNELEKHHNDKYFAHERVLPQEQKVKVGPTTSSGRSSAWLLVLSAPVFVIVAVLVGWSLTQPKVSKRILCMECVETSDTSVLLTRPTVTVEVQAARDEDVDAPLVPPMNLYQNFSLNPLLKDVFGPDLAPLGETTV